MKERASQWDQSESEYVKFAEKYLGFQQPDSVYRFSDAGNGFRKVCFYILYWSHKHHFKTLKMK